MDLGALYEEVILDHNRSPRNWGEIPGAHHIEGRNPLCGDHISLSVQVDGDVITDVKFTGEGCAISKASASMMTDEIKGTTVAEATKLFERFHRMVTTPTNETVEDMGKLSALAGVREFPVRVKCASLAWHTLKAAMDREEKVSTE
jgi:nitrogen fixation NifU-like protein